MNTNSQTFIVLSGKGGVGKSTVAVNLAVSFAESGFRVGLLDIDIHGPSVPVMLGLQNEKLQYENNKILPYEYSDDLCVMSLGFLLEDPDSAAIWRGPMKYNVIKQFIEDVQWPDLDYLIVDCPPGTGDEPLSVMQLLKNIIGAIIVTTPQQVALADVKRSIGFCRTLKTPITGIIENMSGFICPHCNRKTDIFRSIGAESLARDSHIPLLGKIPVDPRIGQLADQGEPFVNSSVCSEMKNITDTIIQKSKENS